MPTGLVPTPDVGLALRPLLGTPLVAWAVVALRRALRVGDVAVVTSDGEIASIARRMGVVVLGEGDEIDGCDCLIADARQPFCSEATVRGALAARVQELAAEQVSPVERLRIRSDADFELAEAVARGLPPDHECLRGVRGARLAMGSRTRTSPAAPVRVEAVVSDVDGVLTDATITLTAASGGAEGETKSFNMQDGVGTRLLTDAGLKVAWLSAAQDTGIVRRRAARLGVHAVDVGEGDKGARFLALCAKLGVDPLRTLYIGDDVNDLPAIAKAGRSACPADARQEVRAAADVILEARGGRAAFREAADLVLDAMRLPA